MCARIQTAMIIDDDVDFCKLMTNILERRKIHVLSVHTLTEAEDCLTYLKPSVIFLDNSFPEGLGINFIRYIHSVDSSIRIVMTTGDTDRWIKAKAIEEGINHFMFKPIDLKMINTVLDDLKFTRPTIHS